LSNGTTTPPGMAAGTSSSSSDGLFNARALLAYRLR
jgi:hypothetical protein